LAATRDARIVPVWAPENRCVVDAYFRGYREAFEAPCRWILEMDAGLSHRPEDIPKFLAAMEAGFDFAGGSRFIKGGSHDGSLWRFFVSWGGTVLANLLLGTRMKDMTSGFECFSRRAMQLVLDHGVHSKAHFFQTEIRTMMHALRWVEVPIRYINSSKALGASPIRDALRSLRRLRREARAFRASRGAA
jgi:dolichol-phosphate mannosyltransferase